MAQTIFLFLKVDGAEVKGDSPVKSLGRQDAILCASFDQGVAIAAGGAASARAYDPVRVRKPVDKATPLIAKAVTVKQPAEAVFRFYRTEPSVGGKDIHFFTIELKDARILSQRILSAPLPDAISPRDPPIEEIAFSFGKISWEFINGGIFHEDEVPQRVRPPLPVPDN